MTTIETIKRVLATAAVVLLSGAPGLAQADERPARQTLLPTANRGLVELDLPTDDQDVVRQLEIETGKSVFVKTTYPVKRVSVGSPATLDVVVLGSRELQLVAKEIGTTNLLIWDKRGMPQAAIDIHVGAPHSRLQSELRRILGSEDVAVDSAGTGIVLKGSVPSAVAMEQTLAVARAVLAADGREAKKIVNLMEVRGHQQVMLKVVIAEMSRSVRMEFGTNFRALIESGNQSFEVFGFLQGLTGFGEPGVIEVSDMINLAGNFTGLGELSNLQVFMDILENKGLSKILAEPTLVARSGEPANFLVGGEVPIPVAQGGALGQVSVDFKDFGVGVSFTPTVLEEGRIHLKVAPEVSEPDFSFGTVVEGIRVPGFNTRRASTAIELGDGQSFAIAGLLRDDLVEVSDMYPILGEIPVLGALFRSSQYQKRQTELVIIVTPHLVKPLDPGPTPLPTDHFIEPSRAEFYFLGALEGRAPEDASSGSEDLADTRSGSAVEAAPPAGFIGDVGHRVSALAKEND